MILVDVEMSTTPIRSMTSARMTPGAAQVLESVQGGIYMWPLGLNVMVGE